MKTIGLVGGTGWISTIEYYRLINEETNRRLGGDDAARCVLYSLNYGDIARLREQDNLQSGVRPLVVDAARRLERAGAECIGLCANTLHWFARDVQAAVSIPLVHIAVATAAQVTSLGIATVGLLGTRPTMEREFYTASLRAAGLTTLIPGAADRDFIDRAILDELVHEIFRPEVKQRMLDIIGDLARGGAEGVILGCTEIPLLIGSEKAAVPLFDTLRLHAHALVDHALSE